MKYINQVLSFIRLLGRPFPLRDWYIAVGISFIVVAILILLATNFFFGIRSGSIITSLTDNGAPTPSVSRDALKNVLSAYEVRLTNYSEGNVRTPSASDPSR